MSEKEDSNGLQRKLIRIEMSKFQDSSTKTKFKVSEIERDIRKEEILVGSTFFFFVDRTKLHPEDKRHLIAGSEIIIEYEIVGKKRMLKALYPPCYILDNVEEPFYVFE